MSIDEAGRYRQAGRVDAPASFGIGQVADRRHPVAGHADGANETLGAGAVHDGAVSYHKVEHDGFLSSPL